MDFKTCAITGTDYKLLSFGCNEKECTCIEMKIGVADIISRLILEDVTTFVTNCEYGIPLWISEIICGLKLYNDIKLRLEIPFEGQANLWYEDWRNRYYRIHEQADAIYIPKVWELKDDEPYKLCDRRMAKQSDMILHIGVLKDKPYIAKCAKGEGIPIIYYEPHSSICFFDA